MAFCLACSCFRPTERKTGDKNVKSAEDENKDNAEYGTIQNPQQNGQSKRKFGISLKCFKERKENEAQASCNGSPLRGSFNGKAESKKTAPNKKVSFSWRYRRRKSTTCSGGPTYDYIDAINDPVYSKVDENPSHSHRYDYPTFASYSQRRQQNEPFYTSASQIYSMAGDDPYSSIVSELDNARGANYDLESNSSAYEVGYEKVAAKAASSKVRANGISTLRTPKRNLDALYAKINRPSIRECNTAANSGTNSRLLSNGGRNIAQSIQSSTSSAFDPPLPNNSVIEINTSNYQLEESGSGSVGSCYTGTGSSQNPSYRYLTVRESVDVIRERIRQQELANNIQADDTDSFRLPHREHYYSTIANEYESVGGDDRSLVNGQNISNARTINDAHHHSEQSSQQQHQEQQQRHQQTFRILPTSSSLTSPLSLLTGRFQASTSNKFHNVQSTSPKDVLPKPPISPVPNRSLEELRSPLKLRPVILSPTLPLPDSIAKAGTSFYNSSKSRGEGFQFAIPQDSSNSHPNLPVADYNSSIQQNGNIPIASSSPHPPPPIILPRVPPISSMNTHYHSGTMDANASHQRYSYSYDPRTATFVAHMSNLSSNGPVVDNAIMRSPEESILGNLARRNRISAPTSHAVRAASFLNGFDALTPPPLPPLPTPFKTSNMPSQLLKKATEICEDQHNNIANDVCHQASRPTTSRIPVSARHPLTLKMRSRTPSPTAEIGTQTTNLAELSSRRGNRNSRPKIKSSDESVNLADDNCRSSTRLAGRKLSPPPMPVGNDYVSTVDLGTERGWPLSSDKDKIDGNQHLESVQSDS